MRSFETWKPNIAEQMLHRCSDRSQVWSCALLQQCSTETDSPHPSHLRPSWPFWVINTCLEPAFQDCSPPASLLLWKALDSDFYHFTFTQSYWLLSRSWDCFSLLNTLGHVLRCWHVSPKPFWLSSNLICCGHAGGWIDNGMFLIDLLSLRSLT